MSRVYEIKTVKEVEDGAIHYSDGWVHSEFDTLKGKVKPGDNVVLETKGFSTITGILDIETGQWYFRKSDEDLEREYKEFKQSLEAKRQIALEKHREEWQARTDALPDWVKTRIDKFLESPKFAAGGWEYELVVAELAVMYAESDGEDTDAIMEYSNEQGASGNQHECAKSLARYHAEGESLYGTVSALSPITGDPYYENG